MRQVGIVAAAGIISLEKMIDRLADDHAHARKLADGLRQTVGIDVDDGSPYTNMVYLNLSDDTRVNMEQVGNRMKDLGVLLDVFDPRRLRLVTHYWIDDEAVEKSVMAFKKVMS